MSINELALYFKKGDSILRAVVSADFAKKFIGENFNEAMLQEFTKRAKPTNDIVGFGKGYILVDYDKKKVISAQIAFGLDSLENIYEPWEYIEEGLYNIIKAIDPKNVRE